MKGISERELVMLIVQKIEEEVYKSSGSSRIIGQFLLENRLKLHEYSMQEIADKTYTSKSTLVRFAKTLGFAGWKEFMEQLLKEAHFDLVHQDATNPNFPFQKGDSLDDIAPAMGTLMTEAILETMDLLNYTELEKAVNLLQEKRDIVIFAESPNLFEGELFGRKMYSIGRKVSSPKSDIGLHAYSLDEKNTVAILISYSGNSKTHNPIKIIPILQMKKIPIIAITGLGDSTLRNAAECVLDISSRERLYSKISTFATEISINYLLNTLFAAYFEKEYEANLEKKIEMAKTLEDRYTNYVAMREDD